MNKTWFSRKRYKWPEHEPGGSYWQLVQDTSGKYYLFFLGKTKECEQKWAEDMREVEDACEEMMHLNSGIIFY